MRFRSKNPPARHVIDDDTGIELIEKDWEETAELWVLEGIDHRRYGFTFIFRDPKWIAPDGGHDIEFRVKGLERMYESKRPDGTVVQLLEIYGVQISREEFAKRFSLYAKGDPRKIHDLEDFLTQAILFYLGKTQDKTVTFA
jgi:hypothetical protein